VIALDAYALVALVADEPAAGEVEAILRGGGCRVVVVNLAEAIDICGRVHGLPGDEVRRALEPLFLGGILEAAASGEEDAWSAARIRGTHYDRRDRQLSLADCLLLAHATRTGDRIATADPPLASVGRMEGCEVIALPDSSGVRP
jgi:predicted nucleic acid-binding protein